MFSLNEIISALTGKDIPAPQIRFSEAVVDSRIAGEGMLFAAIPGEQTDGHRFVSSAFAGGAAAALIQEDVPGDFSVLDLREGGISGAFSAENGKPICIRVENTVAALQKIAAYHRRQLKSMDVVGITGTVGKTTTKELTYAVLSCSFNTLKTLGNMNNEIGLPLTLLRASAETEQAVLEMGFYVPGEIDQLCGIALPSVGVITNVGMVHASRAGSMEVIAQGKSELVRALPETGTAILNYDDPYVRPMKELTKADILYYGLDNNADLYADNIESLGSDGIRFDLVWQGKKYAVRSRMTGRHSVLTALRGAAVGLVKNIEAEKIVNVLENHKSQIRMRLTRASAGGQLIDDSYNASPESTTAALDLLRDMTGTKIAVLGEMRELGQYEEKGHRMVGRKAASCCDELLTVGPVTRFIAEGAADAGMAPEKIHRFGSAEEAAAFLKDRYGTEGQVILVKGSRAMRMEQIVNVLEEKI